MYFFQLVINDKDNYEEENFIYVFSLKNLIVNSSLKVVSQCHFKLFSYFKPSKGNFVYIDFR
jgi:hypothetical protein